MAAASAGSTAANDGMSRSSSVQRLLSLIAAERRREKKTDEGFVVVRSSQSSWAAAFTKYFVEGEHEADDLRDDLLFFVRDVGSSSDSSTAEIPSSKEKAHTVDVFRRHSPNLPSLGSADVNWEESVYLNLILQQFEYTLTCAVCTRTGERELQILKKSSQRVYASPSHRQMDSKGTEEVITYPDIFFCVDNFDEAFSDIVVRDSEIVCVELVARDRHGNVHGVIFLGSVRYEALKTVYDNRNSISAKMKGSLSWMITSKQSATPGGSRKQRLEFIKMRGPLNKGYAEMAVGRQCNPGEETPLATPSSTPAGTPETEWAPSIDGSTEQVGAEGSTGIGRRANSQSSSDFGSLLRNGLRRGLTMKKSQSLNNDAEGQLKACEEVEAKSISDELQSKPSAGFLGKSFGQAWHWFKEQRRVASVSLNAHVTYVTLPWHRIIEDVLEVRRQPVLVF